MDEKPHVFDLQPVHPTDEEISLRSEIEGTTMSENPNTEHDNDPADFVVILVEGIRKVSLRWRRSKFENHSSVTKLNPFSLRSVFEDQCSELRLLRWEDVKGPIDNEFISGHVINPRILSELKWQTIRNSEWYFLCQRGNSLNGNRKYGFCPTRCPIPIGYKMSFSSYHGHDTSDESSKLPVWMMHEFRLPGTNDHTRPPNQLELNRFPQQTVSPQEAEFSQVNFRISPIDQRLCSLWMLQVVDDGATEENLADNQSKGRVEDIAETCVDIEDRYHELATTNWLRQIDPNRSSADFFYIIVALILALTGQAAFTLIGLSSSTPTLSCPGALNVVGFIGALSAMLLRYRLPKVARYLGKVSVVIGAAAVVAAYAACFHPEITWSWGLLCGIALLIPSVAVLFA